MISMGFMTIGIPKMTGSLMLKMPAPIDNLPKFFACWLRALNSINTTNANVAPEPPVLIKISTNSEVTTLEVPDQPEKRYDFGQTMSVP
jgi:hypothetical protein